MRFRGLLNYFVRNGNGRLPHVRFPCPAHLMAAGDEVALLPKVFGKFAFHNDGGFERHGVVQFVEFGEETDAVFFNDFGGFEPLLVILEAFGGVEAGHPHVNAGFGGIAAGVLTANPAAPATAPTAVLFVKELA